MKPPSIYARIWSARNRGAGAANADWPGPTRSPTPMPGLNYLSIVTIFASSLTVPPFRAPSTKPMHRAMYFPIKPQQQPHILHTSPPPSSDQRGQPQLSTTSHTTWRTRSNQCTQTRQHISILIFKKIASNRKSTLARFSAFVRVGVWVGGCLCSWE